MTHRHKRSHARTLSNSSFSLPFFVHLRIRHGRNDFHTVAWWWKEIYRGSGDATHIIDCKYTMYLSIWLANILLYCIHVTQYDNAHSTHMSSHYRHYRRILFCTCMCMRIEDCRLWRTTAMHAEINEYIMVIIRAWNIGEHVSLCWSCCRRMPLTETNKSVRQRLFIFRSIFLLFLFVPPLLTAARVCGRWA